jgi:REP element-mobilizing transposase RayT
MSNHLHLICRAKVGHNLSGILRDFKKFTSSEILKAIKSNIQESRKEWILWMFKHAEKKNPNNKYFQLWQQDNHPIELSSNFLIDQKLDYIHQNPVKAGIVLSPEEYLYSSAKNYSGSTEILLKVDLLN